MQGDGAPEMLRHPTQPGPTWDEYRSLERRVEAVEVFAVLAFIISATLLACFVVGLVVLS